MEVQPIANYQFSGDFWSIPAGYGAPDTLGDGSRNILSVQGLHKKVFRGLSFLGKGSRVLKQVKDTYGGLSDYVSGTHRTDGTIAEDDNTLTIPATGTQFAIGDNEEQIQLVAAGPNGLDLICFLKYISNTEVELYADEDLTVAINASDSFTGDCEFTWGTLVRGSGGLFAHIANSLFFQGSGQLTYQGTDIDGATASSSLQVLLQRNGSYIDTLSGPYTAGLTQSSAPIISPRDPSAGFLGMTSGAVSLKVSTIRSITGGKSIASPTSNVISVTAQTVVAQVPLAPVGADYWVFYSPYKGFGGVGIHYRFPVRGALQIAESYFTRELTDVVVTTDSKTITSLTGDFTSVDEGKQIVLSGGGSLTTTIESINSPTSVELSAPVRWTGIDQGAEINAMLPATDDRTVTDAVCNGTPTITSPTAAFTAADEGKQIYLSGGTGPTDATRTIVTFTNATTIVVDTLVAASTGVTAKILDVDGAVRAIELEWQDSDLTTEAAPIDDYPPPAGTHCFALGPCVNVGGCYSDAVTSPTTDNPGTCIAVSLPNFPESYRPTDLLFLPEQLLDFLQRPTDSYGYAGCRNSIHQVQYIGPGSGAACVLTTLWPDVGIANPHGWAQMFGILFVAAAKGGLVTMNQYGRPDSTFATPVREYIKGWDNRYTVITSNPDTMQVTFSNLGRCVAYCIATGGWSTPVIHSDFADGDALSGVATENRMKITMNDRGTHALYLWNEALDPDTIFNDGTWTVGSSVLASGSANFQVSDEDKVIWFREAGVQGEDFEAVITSRLDASQISISPETFPSQVIGIGEFSFGRGIAASNPVSVAMSQWMLASGGNRTIDIEETIVRIRFDNIVPAYISLHRNMRPQTDETASITAGFHVLNVTTPKFFRPNDVGNYVLVAGAGDLGRPLIARIKTFVSATQVLLGDTTTAPPVTAVPNKNAAYTVSGALLIIGRFIFERTPDDRLGYQLFEAKRWRVPEVWAWSLGITMFSNTGDAMALGASLLGVGDNQPVGATR